MTDEAKKYKLPLIALLSVLGVLFALCIFNYDKIVSNIIKKLPESLNTFLSDKYMPDKIWLHRVDSTGKQIELSEKYNRGGYRV